MLKKKSDPRVEILSYLNENKQKEYYPSFGFPLEIFIINEWTNVILFTKENLNTSNFFYFIPIFYKKNIAISLKKLLYIGSFSYYDHFFYDYTYNFNYKIKNNNTNQYIYICSLFLSQILDIKINQFSIINMTCNDLPSLSSIFFNAS